jgi:hypothetical protein
LRTDSDRRVVDQHVELAEPPVDFGEQGLDIRRVADVDLHRHGLVAELRRDVLKTGEIPGGRDHRRALLDEPAHHGAPQAAARAGHDDDLAVEPRHRALPWFWNLEGRRGVPRTEPTLASRFAGSSRSGYSNEIARR